MKSKNRRKYNRLTATIAVLMALNIVALALPIKAPDKVSGVIADACYSEIDISWDKVKGAGGYSIYSIDDTGTTKVGETGGADACTFAFKDYERNKTYEFAVAATGRDGIIKKAKEGDLSESVTTFYDETKYAQKIPILTYHDICINRGPNAGGLKIAEEVFDEQMKYLYDNGFKTLTLDEFQRWYEGKLEVPPKSCVVTFDDGYYGVYHLAYPIIKKYDQAAVLFCVGKKIGKTTDEYDPDDDEVHFVGEDAIEKVRVEYPDFQFESHTYGMHTRVNGRIPVSVYSDEEMIEDCKNNEQFEFRYLAYPWGRSNERFREIVKNNGYDMAFAYRPFYYATRDDNRYAVNRIKIWATIPFDKFTDIVNGTATEYDPEAN